MKEELVKLEEKCYSEHCEKIEMQSNISETCEELVKLENEITEKKNLYEEEIEALKENVKVLDSELDEKSLKLEDLAFVIEKNVQDKLQLQDEFNQNKMMQTQKKTKSQGFFWWIFPWNWFFSNDVNEEYSFSSLEEDDDEERIQKGYNISKSTLLTALQNERQSVSDLETCIDLLEQNNTSIMDMLTSRESIIDELQSRIAVFEEDKLLLKTSLSQLQDEIKLEIDAKEKLQTILHDLENEMDKYENKILELTVQQTDNMTFYENLVENKTLQLLESQKKIETFESLIEVMENRFVNITHEVQHLQSKSFDEERILLQTKIDELKSEYTKMQSNSNNKMQALEKEVVQTNNYRIQLLQRVQLLQSENNKTSKHLKQTQQALLSKQFEIFEYKLDKIENSLDNEENVIFRNTTFVNNFTIDHSMNEKVVTNKIPLDMDSSYHSEEIFDVAMKNVSLNEASSSDDSIMDEQLHVELSQGCTLNNVSNDELRNNNIEKKDDGLLLLTEDEDEVFTEDEDEEELLEEEEELFEEGAELLDEEEELVQEEEEEFLDEEEEELVQKEEELVKTASVDEVENLVNNKESLSQDVMYSHMSHSSHMIIQQTTSDEKNQVIPPPPPPPHPLSSSIVGNMSVSQFYDDLSSSTEDSEEYHSEVNPLKTPSSINSLNHGTAFENSTQTETRATNKDYSTTTTWSHEEETSLYRILLNNTSDERGNQESFTVNDELSPSSSSQITNSLSNETTDNEILNVNSTDRKPLSRLRHVRKTFAKLTGLHGFFSHFISTYSQKQE